MTFRRSSSLLVGVTLAGSCLGKLNPSTPPPERRLNLSIPVSEIEVSSGLRIFLLPDARGDLIEVDVRYDAGSATDPPGKAGLAHLAEHLSFQLRGEGEGRPTLMSLLSTTAISYNAVTSWDYTQMTTLAPADEVGQVLALEATRMSGCYGLDKATFEREREIVKNELRAGAGPGGEVAALLLADLYPDDHPYRRTVGGDEKQLASIKLEAAFAGAGITGARYIE